MSETGLEKHRRIKREQKARFLKKQKEKQATGGLDDGQVKTKFISKATKSRASKLGSGAYSSGSRNPTNFTVKTKKLTKNEATKSDNTKTKDTKNISFKEAQSKGALENTAFNLVPDAFQISKYIKDRLKSNKKTTVEDKKITKVEDKKTTKVADKKPQPPTMSQSVKDKRAKTSASASNTKNFASTMAMQKKLIKMYGANIKADGIMGPKTRAAMKKYLPKKTFNSAFSNKKLTTQERLKEIDKEKANPKKKRAKFNQPKTKKALAAVFKMLKKNKK